MIRYPILLTFLCALTPLPVVAQSGTAQMKGTVVDESGKPIPGARIVYTRKPHTLMGSDGRNRNSPGEWQFTSQVTSDASGNYQILQLPAGDYEWCVDAPGYLATCEWTGWRRSSLLAGQVFDSGAVRLMKAVTVNIRVNDPFLLVPSTSSIASPLAIGVRDQWGRFHPAHRATNNGNSHVFQVDVPYATPLKVRLHSWRFLLADSSGGEVDHWGTEFPFQVAVGASPPSYVFAISGDVNARH